MDKKDMDKQTDMDKQATAGDKPTPKAVYWEAIRDFTNSLLCGTLGTAREVTVVDKAGLYETKVGTQIHVTNVAGVWTLDGKTLVQVFICASSKANLVDKLVRLVAEAETWQDTGRLVYDEAYNKLYKDLTVKYVQNNPVAELVRYKGRVTASVVDRRKGGGVLNIYLLKYCTGKAKDEGFAPFANYEEAYNKRVIELIEEAKRRAKAAFYACLNDRAIYYPNLRHCITYTEDGGQFGSDFRILSADPRQAEVSIDICRLSISIFDAIAHEIAHAEQFAWMGYIHHTGTFPTRMGQIKLSCRDLPEVRALAAYEPAPDPAKLERGWFTGSKFNKYKEK